MASRLKTIKISFYTLLYYKQLKVKYHQNDPLLLYQLRNVKPFYRKEILLLVLGA